MYIYGINPLKFRLENNLVVNEVFLSTPKNDIITLLQKKNIKFSIVKKEALEKMVGFNHQGVVMKIPDFQYRQLENIDLNKVVVILDGIEDPHNLGAIARSAEATGCSAIVLRKDRNALVNATVYKVSTGAIDNIDIVLVSNLSNCIKYLKSKGYWVVGLEGKAPLAFNQIEYNAKTALVIGSEGNGISQLVAKNCDYLINLPMGGKINSFNASNAAAIMLYYLFTNIK